METETITLRYERKELNQGFQEQCIVEVEHPAGKKWSAVRHTFRSGVHEAEARLCEREWLRNEALVRAREMLEELYRDSESD